LAGNRSNGTGKVYNLRRCCENYMSANILRDNVRLPLVEREDILRIIDEQYRDILLHNANENKSALINICGQGGMGKTYIAENINIKYKNYIYYDLEQYENLITDISDILVAIASSTKVFGFKFNLFAIVYELYLKKRQKYSGSSLSKESSYIPIGDIGGVFLDAISITHPVISFAAKGGIAAGKALGIPDKVLNLFSGRKKKVLLELDKCSSVNQLEDFLLGHFIQEMNDNLSKLEEPLVIFIDTYESYFGKTVYKKLKREACIKNLVQSINNVVWIIGGRQPLGWGFGKTLCVDKIKKDESFITIFDGVDVNDLTHRDYIKKETEGNPEYLHQFIVEYNQKKDDPNFQIERIKGGLDDLIQRMCHDLDSSEQKLLRDLCKIGYWYDRQGSMVENILYDFEASEKQYRTLCELGFVVNDHVEKNVRNFILKDISVIDLKNLYRRYSEKIRTETCTNKEFYYDLMDSLLMSIIAKDKDLINEYKDRIYQILISLFDVLEDKTEAFERKFFDLWNYFKESEYEDEISATALILYRKYLLLVNDLKTVNESIVPEIEALTNDAVKTNRRVFWESAIVYMRCHTGLNKFVTEYHLPFLRDTLDSQNRDEVIQYVYATMLNCSNYDDMQNLEGVLKMYSMYLRDYKLPGSKEYFQMSLLAFETIVKLENLFEVSVEDVVKPKLLFKEAQEHLGKNHPLTAEILQYCIAENCEFVSVNDVREQYEFFEELYGNNCISQKWKHWYAKCLLGENRDDLEKWENLDKTIIRLLLELDEWSEINEPKVDWHSSVLFSLYQYYFIIGDDDKAKNVKKRYHEIIENSPYFSIHFEQFFQLESMLNGYRKWKNLKI